MATEANLTASLLTQMVTKKNIYSQSIDENQMNLKVAAERLDRGGELEQLLYDTIGKQEADKFLKEQRELVKEVAIKNIENQRQVDAFCDGLQTLSNDVLRENSTKPQNFTEKINEYVSKEYKRIKKSQVEPYQENSYQEITKIMKERDASKDDDELQIVETSNNTQALKCPLTGKYFENPVKSKLCGHVYEKEAILHHIKATGKSRAEYTAKCPVAGCGNTRLDVDQLEEDAIIKTKVARAKRKEETQKIRNASQADLVDSDDE